MSQQTVKMYLFMSEGYTLDFMSKEWKPDLWACKVDETRGRIYIGERTVTVEVPDDFNPVPKQVAALEREKDEALAKYQQSVAEINERLSKLLAITNEVEA